MQRYTSRTGHDVVLRFNGTIITVPAHGHYETTAGDLEKLFPKHIRKLSSDEIIKEVALIPVSINRTKEPIKPTPVKTDIKINKVILPKFSAVIIPIFSPTATDCITPIPVILPEIFSIQIERQAPITISLSSIDPIRPTTILIPITPISSPVLQDIRVNSPEKLPTPPINAVTTREDLSEKIADIINNSVEATEGDSDIRAFLSMIEDILMDKK